MRRVQSPPLPGRLASALLVALIAASAGACSKAHHAHEQPAWAQAVPEERPRVASAGPRYAPEPGDPIQEAPVLPLRRQQAEPDDPSEPFSPNYGGPNAPKRVAAVPPARIVTAGAD